MRQEWSTEDLIGSWTWVGKDWQRVGNKDVGLAEGTTGGVRLTQRRGEQWISVPKLGKQPEPENLETIKAEVARRWGTLDLLDVLKDADFLTNFAAEFASAASRESLDRDTLRRRLLLDLFALGTNPGIRAIVNTGEHSESEAALRHVRRHFITRDNLRRACIYSQVKSCSSSEVAEMIERLLQHCTDAEIEANYVDTHGASVVGFAFTELLGFKLLPRLKNIGSMRMYRPDDTAVYGGAGPGADPPDPVEAHRSAVRPDGQIRNRVAAGHCGVGVDPAAVHPWRPETPYLSSPGGVGPGGEIYCNRRWCISIPFCCKPSWRTRSFTIWSATTNAGH